jgi:putative membrane protein
MAEVLVVYLHYMAMIAIALCLAFEYLLCAPGLSQSRIVLLLRVDLLYLGAAVVALATGLARLAWFGKGVSFYLHNPVFYIKLALFVAVALISLPPTLQFLRWGRALRAGTGSVVADYQAVRLRRHVLVEIALFLLIPLMAVLMARGIGSQATG